MTTTVRALPAAALLLAAGTAASAQAKTPDRVTPRQGNVVEGTVLRETWKEVVVKPSSGPDIAFQAADIARIDYSDAPDAFKAAMGDVEAGNWQEALGKINSAEELVSGRGMDPKARRITVRPWFQAWVTYYRGLCLRELDRFDDALKEFRKHIESGLKDPGRDSRLLPLAYESAMECTRFKGDTKALEDFAGEIAKAPKELQPKLLLLFDKQKAELLLLQGKADEARAVFEKLAAAPDPQVKVEGTKGVIRAFEKGGKVDELVRYCTGVLKSTPPDQVALLLLASNAVGSTWLEKKQYRKAAEALTESVVKYHPGREAALLREHERALYKLAQAYESWSSEAQGDLKKFVRACAARTYRELSMIYPNGRYRDEATAAVARLDAQDEKK